MNSDIEHALSKAPPTVIGRFDHWVANNGGKQFIYFGDEDRHVTYLEFDRLTNSLASSFAQLGVGKGDRIAVYSTNAFSTACVMYACWKIGGLFCPINNQLRSNLLLHVLDDLQPTLLMVDQGLLQAFHDVADALGSANKPKVVIGLDDETALSLPNSNAGFAFRTDLSYCAYAELLGGEPIRPSVSIGPDDLSSIIYTSGTTGPPKGVVQQHSWLRGLAFSLGFMTHPDDIIYSDLPLYHIGGAFTNVVRAGWSGASIGLWNRFSPTEYWPRIRKCQASIAILLDIMVDWIVEQPLSNEDRHNTIIRAHMQPLKKNHHEIAKRYGIDFIAVGYGSTELGVVFTGLIDEFGKEFGTPVQNWRGYSKEEIRASVAALAGKNAIVDGQEAPPGFMGMPTKFYKPEILNKTGQVESQDATGKLVVQPLSPFELFREYLNKPAETAKTMASGRFKSGDLVSRDANDVFCFVGRELGFIRVRGENISATVIEDLLRQNPHIANCIVLALDAEHGDEDDIAAFVVLKEDADLDEAGLSNWIDTHLPKFMRPRFVRLVSELPLTSTMKVKRDVLRATLVAEIESERSL